MRVLKGVLKPQVIPFRRLGKPTLDAAGNIYVGDTCGSVPVIEELRFDKPCHYTPVALFSLAFEPLSNTLVGEFTYGGTSSPPSYNPPNVGACSRPDGTVVKVYGCGTVFSFAP